MLFYYGGYCKGMKKWWKTKNDGSFHVAIGFTCQISTLFIYLFLKERTLEMHRKVSHIGIQIATYVDIRKYYLTTWKSISKHVWYVNTLMITNQTAIWIYLAKHKTKKISIYKTVLTCSWDKQYTIRNSSYQRVGQRNSIDNA